MDRRSTLPKRFLTPAEKRTVEEAVARAEGTTSGEIRVAVVRKAGDALAEAGRLFTSMGMDRTADRNGVLILLAVADRRFAIVGDRGVDAILGADGWQSIRDEMAGRFAAGEFGAGLAGAVERVGSLLAANFPRRPDDVNELPDSVVEIP
jgi:uncharacterized membrane protein